MSSRATLKTFFETGDVPTQTQFEDLIDSLAHLVDDLVSQTEAEAGTSTTPRIWSAERIKQAIEFNSTGYRRQSNESCNGTFGQVIPYNNAPFVGAGRPFIEDFQGLGIEVTSYDNNGFTINSLASGNFGYKVERDK